MIRYRLAYFDTSDRCMYFSYFSTISEAKLLIDKLIFASFSCPSDLYFILEGVVNDEEV